MKKSTMLAAALVSGSLLSGSRAFADGGFGKGGEVVLSAERLFGLSFTSNSNEDGGGGSKTTDSKTEVSLFGPPLSLLLYSPYTTPRLAFDYVVPGGFSIGGSLGFISGTGTTKVEPPAGPSSESDDTSITILTLAPRVGYTLPLTPFIAFWPRAGVTYYSIKTENPSQGAMPSTTKTSTTGLGVNLEPMFVLSPADHFGIVAGPVVDIPLSGTSSTERTPPLGAPAPDDKVKFMNWGLAVGLLGYF